MPDSSVKSRHVVFSHGQASGPWGRKISALAEVARSEQHEAHSVDYRDVDEPRAPAWYRPNARTRNLTWYLRNASLLHARGVFLMAPALYVEGLPGLRAGALDCPVTVVHGWRDEVVPFEHSVRFAQSYHAALHLLESDHLLHNQIRVLQYLFEYFLIALDMPTIAQA